MPPAAGDPSPPPSFAAAMTTPDGWHPRTAEHRLLHLLHHFPLARGRLLELLAFAVCRALPCSPASPHHHALAALLLLSSPPTPALPLLRLLPPDPSPPLTLLNAAVKALSASSSPDDAFRLLSTLRRFHAPDRLTFLPLLGCASSSLLLLSALHSLLLRLGFLSHHPITLALLKPYPLPHVRALFDDMPQKNKCTVAYNTLITACLKARDIRTARHLFDEMQRHRRSRRSVVSWNLIITGCARNGRDDMAVQCFERMVREGEVAPDDGTLVAVLPCCGRTGNVGAGRWAHEYAKTGMLDGTVHVANAVMDMYCKYGDVDSAREVFMTTRQHSVVSWNAIIASFSLNGHGVEGIDLFQEMTRHGVEPNAVTFLAVLGCCANAGAVDVGREIFQSMLSVHGIEPAIEHYGCMVDLFGRSGLLEEAHALIQGMPMKPNAAIWGALLSACRAHAGLGIAEVALKELIDLEPWNSGNYVLLANLYAETERWEEAGEVRRLMRRMSVNKAPGQSLMEEAEFQLANSYQ